MHAKPFICVGILQEIISFARTSTLPPVLLSKSRLRGAQAGRCRMVNGRHQSSSSIDLGFRIPTLPYSSAQLPRYTPKSPPSPSSSSGPVTRTGSIHDDEWNMRAGRAIYTLRTTLPNFFETGLVSNVDQESGLPALPCDEVTPDVNVHDERPRSRQAYESIYAPNIKLSYTPPTALSLPSAFPRTLQVEGLPLYHASATFVRHTLSAFNTDLHVDLCKLHVHSMGTRHRQIVIRTIVTGRSRLSGSRNEWEVLSTYTLSPHSALIDMHVVESIHPAPHITFYDGFRAALARMAGIDVDRQANGGMRGCVSDGNVARNPFRA